jgi:hypothetical protein
VPRDSHSLAVIVHENNEVTVKDGRGLPHLCRDCRHSGWLTKWHYQTINHPSHCLFYSGGADVEDGDRIIFNRPRVRDPFSDWKRDDALRDLKRKYGERYPRAGEKNKDGKCEDYVPAKKLPWWSWRRWIRPWRVRMMRE